MNHFLVWDVASHAWTEVGLEDSEYIEYAKELALNYEDWNQINKVIVFDVCGAFSIMSLSFIFSIIPIIGLLLITPMPDWGYDEDYLRAKIKNWEAKPTWVNFMNPLRLAGYPLALIFVLSVKRKLKRQFNLAKNT